MGILGCHTSHEVPKKTPEKKQKREKREKMGQAHLHVGATKFCLKCLLW